MTRTRLSQFGTPGDGSSFRSLATSHGGNGCCRGLPGPTRRRNGGVGHRCLTSTSDVRGVRRSDDDSMEDSFQDHPVWLRDISTRTETCQVTTCNLEKSYKSLLLEGAGSWTINDTS